MLRFQPVSPLLVPQRASTTCPLGEYLIPDVARVLVNDWAIHRDPSIWDNPLAFELERFLGERLILTVMGMIFTTFLLGQRGLEEDLCRYSPGSEINNLMYLYSFHWQLPEGTKLDLSEKLDVELKKIIQHLAPTFPLYILSLS